MNYHVLLLTYADLEWYQKPGYDAYSGIGNGSMDGILDQMVRLLKINSIEADIITSLWNLFLPLAYSLIVFYFVMDITEKATLSGGVKELDLKFWLSSLLKFVFAQCLMHFGLQLIGSLLSLGNAALNLANTYKPSTEAISGVYPTKEDYLEYFSKIDWMQGLFLGAGALVINIVNAAVNAVILLQVFAKKIEIIFMTGLSCLAFAQCFSEGGRSGAMKYVKKILACVIHAATIIIIAKICNKVGASMGISELTDPMAIIAEQVSSWDSTLKILLTKFAAIGSISVVKSIINDAIAS